MPFLIVFGIVFFVIIVIVVITDRIDASRSIRRMNRLEHGIGKVTPFSENRKEKEGPDIFYRYDAKLSRRRPECLKVWIRRPSHGEFSVRRESTIDTILGRIFSSREIQTGDYPFDASYTIAANTPRFTSKLLSFPEKRDAIRQLDKLGFSEIRHDGDKLEAVWRPFRPSSKLPPDFLDRAHAALMQLGKDMPEMEAAATDQGAAPNYSIRKAAIYVFIIMLGIFGIIFYLTSLKRYAPMHKFQLLAFSLLFSLPLMGLFFLVVKLLFRGWSHGPREIRKFILYAMAAFLIFGWGLAIFLNGALDGSDPRIYDVLVVDKEPGGQGKYDLSSYNAFVESWRPGRKTERIVVTSSVYKRIRRKQTKLRIGVKDGLFGFEWILAYKIL